MPILLYIFFATLPLWNFIIAGHINPVEIAILLNLFFLPLVWKRVKKKLYALDYLVLIYLLWNLLSIFVNQDSIYIGMRTYRYNVFVPFLIYLIIRTSPLTIDTLRKCIYASSLGVVFQCVMIILFYLNTGMRPVGEIWAQGSTWGAASYMLSMITLSFWCCFTMLGLLLLKKPKARFFFKAVTYTVIMICFIGLIVTSTRAAIVSFILFSLILISFKSSRNAKKISLFSIYALISTLILSIAFVSPVKPITNNNFHHQARTLERIANTQLITNDLYGRLWLWKKVSSQALEKPVFGHGISEYTIGQMDRSRLHYGTSHNVIVSSLYTTGVIGSIIMLSLLLMPLRRLAKIKPSTNAGNNYQVFIMISLIILIIISISNDLSAGRASVLFFLIGLSMRINDLDIDNKEKQNVL